MIYGSIFRSDELLNDVTKHYPKEKIIFIDGEDEDFHFRLNRGSRYRFFRSAKLCTMQKWDFITNVNCWFRFRNIFRPISFAIPEELIVEKIPEKKSRLAFIVPGKIETYIYNDEESYYKGYQEAIFGMTCKKCGWDCLRHYEILANGCIPYFPDIADLPPDTMTFFPKALVRYGNMLYDKGGSDGECQELNRRLLEHTRKFLTTRFLAEYLLLSASAQ